MNSGDYIKEYEKEKKEAEALKNKLGYTVVKINSCYNCAHSKYDCPEEKDSLRCALLKNTREHFWVGDLVSEFGICDHHLTRGR